MLTLVSRQSLLSVKAREKKMDYVAMFVPSMTSSGEGVFG